METVRRTVDELNELAEKMTGTNPKAKTDAQALNYIEQNYGGGSGGSSNPSIIYVKEDANNKLNLKPSDIYDVEKEELKPVLPILIKENMGIYSLSILTLYGYFDESKTTFLISFYNVSNQNIYEYSASITNDSEFELYTNGQ